MTPPRCRLYLISPPNVVGHNTPAFLGAVEEALDAGDVACLQLRLKELHDNVVKRSADLLRPILQDHDVAFIMNDRPDLARDTGCDGVHLGQDDLSYTEARRILGEDAIVGMTCHNSIHLAMEAGELGADYVAFGAFFESNTKKRKFVAEPTILKLWENTTTLPCVAIGGITVDNCRPIVEAGAQFIAVAGGVWNHSDGPGVAVEKFNAIFDDVSAS